jgi:serine protease AprX
MTTLRTLGLAALVAFASTAALAGEVDADLLAQIAGMSSNDDVAVIVRFEETLDLKEFRKEFSQLLKALYPDPKDRKLYRKALKRSLLLQKMQQRAAGSSRDVQQWLSAQGVGNGRSLWAINALAVAVPADIVADLAAFPGVAKISSDAVIQGPGPGSAPASPTYYNLDAIAASSLWDLGYTGTGVVVATMDTGADASHPDLGPRYRGGGNSWFDAYGQNASPADPIGHGTQVLGLIVGGDSAGIQIGVAPDAQWISAKVFDNSNQATLSGLHAGFQWVLDPDGDPQSNDAPDFVNNSWVLAGTKDECNQEFATDITLLREAEIGVLYSGGNYGPKSNSSMSPANDTGSLSVGSVDDRRRVVRNSSRGPGACDGGVYPKLVAPGQDIFTAHPMPGGYNVVSGTSFAVAHITGGIALLSGAFPNVTVTELEAALFSTATDLGEAGADNSYGHGLMDLAAAYDALLNGGGPGGGNPGELQLSAASYSITENVASLAVTVTRTNGSTGDVSVDYATSDGSASAGQDYVAASDTLTLLDGETSGSFNISITNDTDEEADETFGISLFNATGGAVIGNPDTATATINDDDAPPPANSPPTANDDSGTVAKGSGNSVRLNLTGNDTDDGAVDPDSIVIVQQPSAATVTVHNDGSGDVTLTLSNKSGKSRSFSYTVRDDQGATSNAATVNITVN